MPIEFSTEQKNDRTSRYQGYSDEFQECLRAMLAKDWRISGKTAVFYTNRDYTSPFWRKNRGAETLEHGFYCIDDTEGGDFLNETIRKQAISKAERDALWFEASRLYAMSVSGNVLALVYEGNKAPRIEEDPKSQGLYCELFGEHITRKADNFGSVNWHNAELPVLLYNPNISTINNVPREALQGALERHGDPAQGIIDITRDLGYYALKMPEIPEPGPPPFFPPVPVEPTPKGGAKLNMDSSETTAEIALSRALDSQGADKTLLAWPSEVAIATPAETRETFYHAVQLPGGIIVDPGPAAGIKVHSLELSTTEQGVVIVNGLKFRSGLSYEEIFQLCEIAENSGSVTATSISNVEGASSAGIIGATLRLADKKLGDGVFDRHSSRPHENLSQLLSLSDDELAARVQRKAGNVNAVVSLQFGAPAFRRQFGGLTCEQTPIKMHFLPFTGGTTSPAFTVSEEQIENLFPREIARIRRMQRRPSELLTECPLLTRIQRYAAVLSLVNAACGQRVPIQQLHPFMDIFQHRNTVIRRLGWEPPSPTFGSVNMEEVEKAITEAPNAKAFLRAVSAAYVHVVNHDPEQLGSMETIVRGELAKRPPDTSWDEATPFGYMRYLACSLAVGAQSPRASRYSASQTQVSYSYESGVLTAASLISAQRIESAFDVLSKMPLEPSDSRNDFTPADWCLLRQVELLCELGYGPKLSQILLHRLSSLAVADPSSLATVSRGVKAGICRCFRLQGDPHLSIPELWEEMSDSTLSPDVFYGLILHSRFTGQFSPDLLCNGETVPVQAFVDHGIASLRSTPHVFNRHITDQTLFFINRFVNDSRLIYDSIDWSLLDPEVPESRAHDRSETTGERRLEAEGKILIAFGKISNGDLSSAKRKYRQLVEGAVVGLDPQEHPVRIFAKISNYLFRKQRLHHGDVGTLVEAVTNNIFDCDTSCHLYFDILARIGAKPQIVLSDRHAHVRINDLHFETRGGIVLPHEEALNRYGMMDEVPGLDFATAVGAIEAISDVFSPEDLSSFFSRLDVEQQIRVSKQKGAVVIGGDETKAQSELSPMQILALTDGIRLAIEALPRTPMVISNGFVAAECLRMRGYVTEEELHSLRVKLASGAYELVNSTGMPSFCLNVLKYYSEELGGSQIDKPRLKAQLTLIGKELRENTHETEASKDARSGDGSFEEYRPEFKEDSVLTAQELHGVKTSLLKIMSVGRLQSEDATEAKEELVSAMGRYIYRVERSFEAEDRELMHCVRAWGIAPHCIGPRADAASELINRHFRPDLAASWVRSLKEDSAVGSNDPQAAMNAARALSYFGDLEGIDAYMLRVHPFYRMVAMGKVEEAKAKAGTRGLQLMNCMLVFTRGGYLSTQSTINFLSHVESLGFLSREKAESFAGEIKKEGCSLETACRILDAIERSSVSVFVSDISLAERREYDLHLRMEKNYGQRPPGDAVVEALKLRDLCQHQAILQMKDDILRQAENIYYLPAMIVLAEAFALTGKDEAAEAYRKFALENNKYSKHFVGFLKEMEICFSIAHGRTDSALAEIEKREEHFNSTVYTSALKKMILERRYQLS